MPINYKNEHWLDKKVILGMGDVVPDQPLNILMGFHGAESLPENMLVHGNKLQLDNTLMIYPEGPIDAGKGLWSWWQDGPRQKETVHTFLDFTQKMLEAGLEYARREINPTYTRVNLWGFSQGAAAALVYALLGNHPIARVASICGFLPELPDTQNNRGGSVSILGIYGMNDEIIPSFLADYALDEMKNRGHEVTVKETPQRHEINSDNIQDLIGFFTGH